MRCHDCNQRFLLPASRGKPKSPMPVLLGGVVALGFALIAARMFQHTPTETRQSVPAIPMPPVKAATVNDAEEQFRRASSLLNEAEINMTYSAEAIELLQQAAERGHARAMLRLGILYRSGFGAVQNFSLAAKWIEKAALSGDPDAMLELGRLYHEGIGGIPKDMVKAYVWFNRAAAARNIDAARERAEVARRLTADELKLAQDQSSVDGSLIAPANGVVLSAKGAPGAPR